MAKPAKKRIYVEANLGDIEIEPGDYIQVHAGERCVEIVCKPDGSLQVCVDDQTFESGVHKFKEIYGP